PDSGPELRGQVSKTTAEGARPARFCRGQVCKMARTRCQAERRWQILPPWHREVPVYRPDPQSDGLQTWPPIGRFADLTPDRPPIGVIGRAATMTRGRCTCF